MRVKVRVVHYTPCGIACLKNQYRQDVKVLRRAIDQAADEIVSLRRELNNKNEEIKFLKKSNSLNFLIF